MDILDNFTDPDAAARALQAAAFAVSAAAIAASALCVAYVAKVAKEWLGWGIGRREANDE